MKVLVTGGAGVLGRDLSPLLAKYHEVKTLDIQKPDNDLEYVHCDLTQLAEVERATADVDIIVHLAALLSAPTSKDFIAVNVQGTCNILEAALRNGVGKVVYASSVWAASRGMAIPYLPIDESIPIAPEGMYDITKRMGEEFCEYFHRMHGLNTMTLRLCGYDPIDGFSDEGNILWDKIDLPALVGRFLGMGPAFKLTNAWDLAQAFKSAIEADIMEHDVFIMGIGAPFASEESEELSKAPLPVLEKHVPGVSEFLQDIELSITPIPFWYDTEKARKQLGFSPKHSLQDVMQQYYANRGGD